MTHLAARAARVQRLQHMPDTQQQLDQHLATLTLVDAYAMCFAGLTAISRFADGAQVCVPWRGPFVSGRGLLLMMMPLVVQAWRWACCSPSCGAPCPSAWQAHYDSRLIAARYKGRGYTQRQLLIWPVHTHMVDSIACLFVTNKAHSMHQIHVTPRQSGLVNSCITNITHFRGREGWGCGLLR